MIEIIDNTDISKMTTFGIPAECGRLIQYETTADLLELHQKGMLNNILPIGGGSNLLFTTGKFDGTVLHCVNSKIELLPPETDGTVTVKAAAGAALDNLCALTCEQNLWGMENLSGIPGEIGGAAVQNVGAYGTEFKDIVETVHCFDTISGKSFNLTNAECKYNYRDSIFKHSDYRNRIIITSVTLKLSANAHPNLNYTALADKFKSTPLNEITPRMMREEVIKLRDSKLPSPATIGSAGSFFKNPVVSNCLYKIIQKQTDLKVPGVTLPDGSVKLSAAWLIDNSGCKSFRCGGAAIWQQQPLVIINKTGTATGYDILELEHAIMQCVVAKFGVDLEPEVVHI